MATPTIATINTAIQNLYDLFATYKTKLPGKIAVENLEEVYNYIAQAYSVDFSVTITGGADATITAALLAAGSLGVAYGAAKGGGNAAPPAGVIFKVNGTGDTTNTALATAKGSAPAANDIFVVTSASAVVYLDTTSTLSFSGKTSADFG